MTPGGVVSEREPIWEFRARRRVEFADTDLAKQVHFARFFVFVETAEHELLEFLGARVHMRHEGHEIGWPRLEATCRYLSPAFFGDVLTIHLRILRKGRTSLTYGFRISRDEILVAEGRMATICCRLGEPGGLEKVPIPPIIANGLVEAPE